MSDTMFQNSKKETSRIPLPSPIPLRRHGSMRLRGEKYQVSSGKENTFSRPPRIDTNVILSLTGNQTQPENRLKRGFSFSEITAKKYENSNMAARPTCLKNGDKNTSEKKSGGTETPNRLRSLSLSLSNTRLSSPKSPSTYSQSSPRSPGDSLKNHICSSHNCDLTRFERDWDDSESIASVASSVASCDHASVARNGTTFSGRSMKYVFHCNQYAGATGEDYLTPTQRAYRQVKKLKCLLHQAQKELEQKDSDILKLTKEVVELRLYKAALSSPEDSSDAVTVKENTSQKTSPEKDELDRTTTPNVNNEMTNSFADSGHFEDCTNSSIHSKDSVLFEDGIKSPFKSGHVDVTDKGVMADLCTLEYGSEHSKLIMEYEKRLQELVRTHEEECYQLKQKQNDKVEELLQRITEINSRYWELVPDLDTAKERIKELETKLEEASKNLEEQETKHKENYLQTYNKSQEAAKVEHENKLMELAHQNPSRVSVPELLQELQVTKNELENIRDVEYASTSNSPRPLLSAKEALSLWVLGARKAMYRQLMEAKSKNKIDPEITLQFLKSAVYYFLTDRENSQGHLRAIQSILGFSTTEIENIDKSRLT